MSQGNGAAMNSNTTRSILERQPELPFRPYSQPLFFDKDVLEMILIRIYSQNGIWDWPGDIANDDTSVSPANGKSFQRKCADRIGKRFRDCGIGIRDGREFAELDGEHSQRGGDR